MSQAPRIQLEHPCIRNITRKGHFVAEMEATDKRGHQVLGGTAESILAMEPQRNTNL